MDITFTTSNDSLPTSHIQPVEYSHTCYQDFLFKLSTFHKNYPLTNNLGDRIANTVAFISNFTLLRIEFACHANIHGEIKSTTITKQYEHKQSENA